MSQNNAECAICGKHYHYCNSCKEQKDLAPWKILTDTSEHYKIFQIIRGYNLGIYTKDECKMKLKNVDLSDSNMFKKNIQIKIQEILAEDKVKVTKQTKSKIKSKTEQNAKSTSQKIIDDKVKTNSEE